MLTAVIRADGYASALAATFSVLIPAVADGFLGHAVVVDAAGDAEIERLADATGASYLRAGLVLPKALVMAGRLGAAPRRLPVRRERAGG